MTMVIGNKYIQGGALAPLFLYLLQKPFIARLMFFAGVTL
jgi:hypothetical protein